MKVSRSYWFGLGSGLILSAMLTLIISPTHVATSAASQTKQTESQTSASSGADSGFEKGSQTQSTQEASAQGNSAQVQSQSVQTPSSAQSPAQAGQSFVVTKGSTAEDIADSLLAQGWITDKQSFLTQVQNLGAGNKFMPGTFTLINGLTPEEIIRRLQKG